MLKIEPVKHVALPAADRQRFCVQNFFLESTLPSSGSLKPPAMAELRYTGASTLTGWRRVRGHRGHAYSHLLSGDLSRAHRTGEQTEGECEGELQEEVNNSGDSIGFI